MIRAYKEGVSLRVLSPRMRRFFFNTRGPGNSTLFYFEGRVFAKSSHPGSNLSYVYLARMMDFCKFEVYRTKINAYIYIIPLIALATIYLYVSGHMQLHLFVSIMVISLVFLVQYWVVYNYASLYRGYTTRNGEWSGAQYFSHSFRTDEGLAKALAEFFKDKASDSVLELGCGNAFNLRHIQNAVKRVACIEGSDESVRRNSDIVQKGDLSLRVRFPSDWVLTFEVGEHIPKRYESVFLDNIASNARKGIIMSWAEKGHGGDGHVNEQNKPYIIECIEKRGFKLDRNLSLWFRGKANTKCYLRNNIIVFTRISL